MLRPTLFCLLFALELPGCVHRASPHAAIACPTTDVSSRTQASATNPRVQLDGPPPVALAHAPYTLVLDDHILAKVETENDTLKLRDAWKAVDMATVRSIEIIRTPTATSRFPSAIGDVVHVVRCY